MTHSLLLVEDSSSARLALESVLEPANFAVTSCATLGDARRALSRQRFDLLVVDVNLPDGDGVEWIRSLGKEQSAERPPVLAISATCDVRARIAALRAGASDFVGKPYAAAFVLRRAVELTTGRGRRAPGPSRVLVVDDSVTYGHALADELRHDGHDVVIASSGEEALDYLDAQGVDCIMLDLFMPGMGGVEVCRELRSRDVTRTVPILMLTGRKDTTAKGAAFEAGVDEFAVKTQDVAGLRERVARLLSRARNVVGQRVAATGQDAPDTGPPTPGSAFFDRVVAASGLSEVLGASVIKRACARVGIRPDQLDPGNLGRALPEIERRLRLFLSPVDARVGLSAMGALARDAGPDKPRGGRAR